MGNKDSDQARQWLRLSLVFAGRIGHFVLFCYGSNEILSMASKKGIAPQREIIHT